MSKNAEALISQMQDDAKGLSSNDEKARERLVDTAYAVINELQTPLEFIERTRWAEPTRNGAIVTAIECGFFDQLAEKKDGATASELAQSKGVEPGFALRMLKHLAAVGVVRQVGDKKFANTKLSEALTKPAWKGGSMLMHYSQEPVLFNMPDWARALNYKNIEQNDSNGPFQQVHKTELSVYGWLKERPELMKHFNAFMTEKSDTPQNWMDDEKFFPVRERLQHPDTTSTTPLIVDVGGGLGQDMQKFSKNFPDLKGKLVLEDQPQVINSIPAGSLGDRIEPLAQNFFEPQKVVGARCYHIHQVLHNWTDASCEKILTQIKGAMKKGYSKLLIVDFVTPAIGAHWRITGLDMIMMSFGALERTEEQWNELVTRVGLKLEKVWTLDPKEESVLEIVLP